MGWALLALAVALSVLAPRFGADSRNSRDWKPTHPWTDGEADSRTPFAGAPRNWLAPR